MNYLAHLYLSGNDKDLLLGNFIADGIKGEDKTNYKKRVLDGVRLHRKIDDFTDSHEIFGKSAQRLKPKYGLYSWVIVDVFYDHFLAANWIKFSNHNLKDYSSGIYQLLDNRFDELPKHSRRFLWYMKEHDILYNYSKLEGIEKVMLGLSRRTKFDPRKFSNHQIFKFYTFITL